jgi:hypothetical protein
MSRKANICVQKQKINVTEFNIAARPKATGIIELLICKNQIASFTVEQL